MMNPPEMQYGIPDPTYDHGTNPAGTQLIAGIGYRINREAPGPEYIWSKDPGILFCKFAIAFYSDESRIDNEGELIRLRASLYHLEEKNK